MKLNKKHIPLYAVVVQTAQYALAGYFLIGWMGLFFVGIMGGLVSLALVYATSQYADIAQGRKTTSLIAMILLMVFSPVLIGTATWLHLAIIPSSLWRGVVSAIWGILPDGAVALAGFIAGKGMFETGKKVKKGKNVAGKNSKKGGKKEKLARKRIKNDELLAYLASNPGATQQQVADHFEVTRQAIGPRIKKLYEVKQ